jgi:hypothetical protein
MSKIDFSSKATFILLCLSILVFTGLIISSYLLDEKIVIIDGYVQPKVYSEKIIYFPIAGEMFATSLVKYLNENNLEIQGMASKNTFWTRGYIIAISPKKTCP